MDREGASPAALREAHAAEVASMQEAFQARTQALEDHLEVSMPDHDISSFAAMVSSRCNTLRANGKMTLSYPCHTDLLVLHMSWVYLPSMHLPISAHGLFLWRVQRVMVELSRAEGALVAAREEVASRQEALVECQDMLAELQAFSEAQQAQLQSLHAHLQV